jgi:hypothetical protein
MPEEIPSPETPISTAFSSIWEDMRSIWLTKPVEIRYNEGEHRVVDLSVRWVVGLWLRRETLVSSPPMDPPFPFRT